MADDKPTRYSGPGEAPPTIRRPDPWGWARLAACAGLVAGLAALALLWRHLPWLPDPKLGLRGQLASWAAGLWARAAHAGGAASRSGLDEGAAWRCALAALAALLPGALTWRGAMAPRDRLVHMRGALRLEGGEAVRELRREFGEAARARPDHDIAPGVPYPADMWAAHVFLAAGTGGGKSTFLRALLRDVFAADEPALVFDPKGEFTANFASAAIVAPWDARSWAWDIGRDLRNVADMRRYAESLVDDSTDPMWANASRQVLVGLLRALRAERGSDWGFVELAEIVSRPHAEIAEALREHSPQALRLVEKSGATSQGILINLAAACAPIFDLAEAWAGVPASRRLSLVDWTLGGAGPRQIILQGHASYAPLTRACVRPIVEVVAALVGSAEMGDDALRKRWLICDEVAALGKCDLPLLIEQGRSRGFRCVLACQSLLQLEEIHGERVARALVSMVGAVVLGRVGPGESAERLAQAIGSREVERPNVSVSTGGRDGAGSSTKSFAREQIPAYLPSELSSRLGARPGRRGVVMALLTGGMAYELFWPFVDLPKARPQMVAAPWTLGLEPARPPARADGGGDCEEIHGSDLESGPPDSLAPGSER